MFTHLPAELLPSFLSYFHILTLPSESLIAQPTPSTATTTPTFCVILSGSVGAFRDSPPAPDSLSRILTSGETFGAESLVHDTAAVDDAAVLQPVYAAVDDSRLLCLTRDRYDAFLTSQRPRSALQATVVNKCIEALHTVVDKERTPADLQLLCGLLVSSGKLFHSLDAPLLNKAATHMQLCYATTGDVIQRAGEESDHMFIVLTGSCSLHAPPAAARSVRGTAEDKDEQGRRREEKVAALVDEQGEMTVPLCDISFELATDAVTGFETELLGECTALLLPTQATPFTDSILSPTFCSRQSHTVIARQPTTLACLSSALLCYLLASIHRTTTTSPTTGLTLPALNFHTSQLISSTTATATANTGSAGTSSGLVSPGRPDSALSQLDQLLKSLPFFQFTQSRVRRLLCSNLRYGRVAGSKVLYQQGDSADVYWIVLSGSVSLHTRDAGSGSGGSGGGGSGGEVGGRVRNVGGLEGLIESFGSCTAVARPFTSFNETALVSSTTARPASHSAITRTACDLLYLTRADYLAVCEPSSDLSSHSDIIIRYMRRKHTKATGGNLLDSDSSPPPTAIGGSPQSTAAEDEDKLWSALLHFPWFADLRADLRSMVLTSLEVEEVEGEVKLFEEGEETDESACMYIIVTGCVGVHLADQKQRAKREREQERKAVGGGSSSSKTTPVVRATTAPSISATLFPPLSPTSGSGYGNSALPTTRSGRQTVSHLSPSELTTLYGPSVTVLPTGSHFGDVALTSSSSSYVRRSATIITVEPCYLLKLARDVVVKVKYLSESASGGSGSGGAKLMSQSAISSFLSSAPLFSGVLSSLSTVKRLAFHAESRHYKQGDVLCMQGEKADCVMLIVEGEGVVSRHYTVTTQSNTTTSSTSSSSSKASTHTAGSTTNRHRQSTSAATASSTHQPASGQFLHSATYHTTSAELPSSMSPLVFSVPLVSLSNTSAVGAYECLAPSTHPHSSTLRVVSASCHVLVVKRAHFMLFYGGLVKGVQRVEEERTERERWWAAVLSAEIDKRVREKRGTAMNGSTQHKTTAKARSGEAGENSNGTMNVNTVTRQLQSLDISTYAAQLHIARLNHLAHSNNSSSLSQQPNPATTTDATGSDGSSKEGSLWHGQQSSISKRGAVYDKSCAQKMRQTLQQVETRVNSNEKRMGEKRERLSWLRAKRREVLQGGTDVDVEVRHGSQDRAVEEEKEEWEAAQASTAQQKSAEAAAAIVAAEKKSESRDAEEVWKLMLQRREEGGPVSPRSFHSFHSSLFQPTTTTTTANSIQQAAAAIPPHIQPLMHAPSSIHALTRGILPTTPSIPHTTATHEDLTGTTRTSARTTVPTSLPLAQSPRFKPLKTKPATAVDQQVKGGLKEESKEVVDEAEQQRVVSSLPLSYHSQSVKSWQEEKKLEYEHKVKQIKRRQLRDKQQSNRLSVPYDEEEEEEEQSGSYEPTVQVWKGDGGAVRVVRLEGANAVPSTMELLMRLEQCQQIEGLE